MLLHADQDRALAYLASCLDQVNSFGDILQLVIVELIYKVRGVYILTITIQIFFYVHSRYAMRIQMNVHVSSDAFIIY